MRGAVLAFDDGQVQVWNGDALDVLRRLEPVAAIVTDPPYGETSLGWDRRPDPEWLALAAGLTRNLWVFGSLRAHLAEGPAYAAAGWRLAQDIVWEKHNGSAFHTDRFKRVHEIAAHYYLGSWSTVHRATPTTADARAPIVRRKERPAHLGAIEDSTYASVDGGPRLMRSVLQVRSEHGRAVHPTQKPLGILRPLIEFSTAPGDVVLDPFAGSGSTALAARDVGRRAITVEAREEYVQATIDRLAQGVLA